MKTLRQILKYGIKTLLYFILSVFVYLLIAAILSVIPLNSFPVKCYSQKELFVSSNGVHVDIIIPVKHLDSMLVKQLKIESSTQYVAFGWGDRKFYLETPTWADLKVSTALQSLLLNTPSVMHVSHYKRKSINWKSQLLCPSQMTALHSYLEESFKKDKNNNFQIIEGAHYGNNDAFYLSSKSYSLLFTCNTWVNKGFKESKIKTALWTPFDWGILRYFE